MGLCVVSSPWRWHMNTGVQVFVWISALLSLRWWPTEGTARSNRKPVFNFTGNCQPSFPGIGSTYIPAADTPILSKTWCGQSFYFRSWSGCEAVSHHGVALHFLVTNGSELFLICLFTTCTSLLTSLRQCLVLCWTTSLLSLESLDIFRIRYWLENIFLPCLSCPFILLTVFSEEQKFLIW